MLILEKNAKRSISFYVNEAHTHNNETTVLQDKWKWNAVYKQEIPYEIGFFVEGIEIWKQNQQIIKHISNEFLFWLHYIFYLLWEIDITLTQNEFVEVILTGYIDPISRFKENLKLTKKAIDDHFIVFYAIRYCTSGNLVDLFINKIFRN